MSQQVGTIGAADRKALVESDHGQLSIQRQCELLLIPRSSFYYQALAPSEEDLRVMRLIDQQYLETPFYGSHKMSVFLRTQGHQVNRKRVQRLMREMGLFAIYPKPNLSKPHPEHRVYPYLLRGLAITQANQVWCTDITYLPVCRGHFYPNLVVEVANRLRASASKIGSPLTSQRCICSS